MSTNNSVFFFDKFENKFVFKISRTFFWIFTAIAILTVIISIFSLLYSIIPPGKDNVTMKTLPPEPITVPYEDVLNEINPPSSLTGIVQPNTQNVQQQNYSKPIQKIKSETDIILDSLGAFFPGIWEGIYQNYPARHDFFGRITPPQRILVRQGLKNIVQYTLNRIKGDPSKIEILKNMTAIIPKFESSKRERALYIYLNILRNKWSEYNNQVGQIKYEYDKQLSQAEANYLNAKSDKEELESKAIKGLGAGIVLIAILGLVLSFLAIERNTRAIRELIEKEKL
jgi:hypothetical protein